MHVVLAEPAERDLVSIIDYIAQDNPPAAEKAYSTIATALRRLADKTTSANDPWPEAERRG
jgi:plasmid stabilization system protein ParE